MTSTINEPATLEDFEVGGPEDPVALASHAVSYGEGRSLFAKVSVDGHEVTHEVHYDSDGTSLFLGISDDAHSLGLLMTGANSRTTGSLTVTLDGGLAETFVIDVQKARTDPGDFYASVADGRGSALRDLLEGGPSGPPPDKVKALEKDPRFVALQDAMTLGPPRFGPVDPQFAWYCWGLVIPIVGIGFLGFKRCRG